MSAIPRSSPSATWRKEVSSDCCRRHCSSEAAWSGKTFRKARLSLSSINQSKVFFDPWLLFTFRPDRARTSGQRWLHVRRARGIPPPPSLPACRAARGKRGRRRQRKTTSGSPGCGGASLPIPGKTPRQQPVPPPARAWDQLSRWQAAPRLSRLNPPAPPPLLNCCFPFGVPMLQQFH